MTWRQRWCALWFRHDFVLAFEKGLMFLRCTSCLHETPGLQPAPLAPRPRYEAKPEVLALSRLRLVPPRRAA